MRYVYRQEDLKQPDCILLPGTKSTLADLRWLRQTGLAAAIGRLAAQGTPVFGICGGYQMLGRRISDPHGVEGGGEMPGLGLLPCRTVFAPQKTRTRTQATVTAVPFAGAAVEGYEIHMGQTTVEGEPFCRLSDGTAEGAVSGNVFGTYLHGLFDTGELAEALTRWLLARRGLTAETRPTRTHREHQEEQLNKLADLVRAAVDLPAIYRAMEQKGERTP